MNRPREKTAVNPKANLWGPRKAKLFGERRSSGARERARCGMRKQRSLRRRGSNVRKGEKI